MADDFRTTEVGDRYAQALFDLALETGRLDAVRADVVSLKTAWIESADLRRLATSPVISADDQVKGLTAVAVKAGFDLLTAKFLGLIATNGRAVELVGAINAFVALSAKHRGVVAAEVTSAAPLSAAQLKAVTAAVSSALGQTPEISTRVDPSILGGVKVRVGSRLFDASVRSKLDSLKFALKRA